MHFVRSSKPDSIIKGYWSANIFQGKRYSPYVFKNESALAYCDVSFFNKSKKIFNIQIDFTKSGKVSVGSYTQISKTPPRVLSVEIIDSKNILEATSRNETDVKSYYTYKIENFPVRLVVILSDSKKMYVDLNRAGEWVLQGYLFSKVETRIEGRPVRSNN